MNPHLMSPSSKDFYIEKSAKVQTFDDIINRNGWPGLSGTNRYFFSIGWVTSQRLFNRSMRSLHRPEYCRSIMFFNAPVFENADHLQVRFAGLCKQQDAGSLLIQTMHDSGSEWVSDVANFGKVMQRGLNDCVIAHSSTGMHNRVCRF